MRRIFSATLFLAGLCLSACAPSFCGAPCERPPRRDTPAKTEMPRENPQETVNQYGSIFGYLELGNMTVPQLRAERSSLEFLLSQNPKDGEILKAFKEGRLDTSTFDYNDYSTGGARFDANGKLRRDATVALETRRLPRMISESQNRELIERYSRIHKRLSLLPEPAPPPEPEVETRIDTPAAPPDPVWSGSYRIHGDGNMSVSAPATFLELGDCESWAQGEADAFRTKAYAFEYECRKSPQRVKRKLW